MTCPTCEGKGLRRLKWNDVKWQFDATYGHSSSTVDRYRDEWCKRCDGKGAVPKETES